MDKRQVLIIALLIVAITMSAVSIVLNLNVNAPILQFSTGNAVSPLGNVAITVNNDDFEVLNDESR